MAIPHTFARSFTPDLRRIVWFEGEGGGGAPPAPAPAPSPAPAPNPAPEPEKQLPQSEVDRLVGGARKEGKQAALTDFLKELGFDKPDELKALVAAHQQQQEAAKTEVQKLADKATAAELERDTLKADLEAERQQRIIDKRNSAIQQAAQGGKDDKGSALPSTVDPLGVLEWAQREANKPLLDAAMDEDGAVNDKGVKALVDAARKNAAHLFAQADTRQLRTPSFSGGRTTQDSDKQARDENFRRMRRET
jgi:hypothetical protein